MKFVDFNDESIPVGKRKVAYVKYAMSHGTSEKAARIQANRKFGFERKGKWVVFLHNARFMDKPSSIKYGVTWEQASGVDCKRAESVIIVCDEYYAPFDIIRGGLLSEHAMFAGLPTRENYRQWAESHGYKVKESWLYD